MRHLCVLGTSSPALPHQGSSSAVPWSGCTPGQHNCEMLLFQGGSSPSVLHLAVRCHFHPPVLGRMENTVFWGRRSPDGALISTPVKSDANPSSGALHCGGRELVNSD